MKTRVLNHIPLKNRLLSTHATSFTNKFGMDSLTKIKACKAFIPEFKNFDDKDFYCKPLVGGLTNLLFTVGLKDDVVLKHQDKKIKLIPETIALVREYGRNTDSFMNRAQEEKIVQELSDQGLCPKVFGALPWGRIENYLAGSRSLSTVEYASPKYLPSVAELLGRFHALSPILLGLCTTEGSASRFQDRMELWYTIAAEVKFLGQDLKSQLKQSKLIALDLPRLKKEISWLVKEIDSVGSPVVFCHADFQEGNCILHHTNLHMIDFEYSERMERGFDIGNCFCEMSMNYNVRCFPGFVIDPDNYPDDEKQTMFIKHYAKGAKIELTDQIEQSLKKEAQVFTMGSHLHWVIWSVIQAGSSTIEFGYLEYAQQRLDQYYHHKMKWINQK